MIQSKEKSQRAKKPKVTQEEEEDEEETMAEVMKIPNNKIQLMIGKEEGERKKVKL